jgi:flagellar basal-body rod modification protein FlgD
METNAIAGAAGVSTPTDRGLNSLKSEDFFRILVTEMQQQDPLSPTETSDMIGQVSQIRSIELSSKLTDTLDTLALQQKTANAGGMVGKYVSAIVTGADGVESAVEGVVMAVRFDSDGATVLELDTGTAVRVDDVKHITTLEALESALGDADDPAADEQSQVEGSAPKDGQTEKPSLLKPWTWL